MMYRGWFSYSVSMIADSYHHTITIGETTGFCWWTLCIHVNLQVDVFAYHTVRLPLGMIQLNSARWFQPWATFWGHLRIVSARMFMLAGNPCDSCGPASLFKLISDARMGFSSFLGELSWAKEHEDTCSMKHCPTMWYQIRHQQLRRTGCTLPADSVSPLSIIVTKGKAKRRSLSILFCCFDSFCALLFFVAFTKFLTK